MRILHVINSPIIGGTERWILDFIAASSQTVDNRVLTFGREGAFRRDFEPHLLGIVDKTGRLPSIARALRFARECRSSSADQIWLHSDLARTYGTLLPRSAKRRVVAVCHSDWGASNVNLRLSGLRLRDRWDGIVAVGESVQAALPVDRSRCRLQAVIVPPPQLAPVSHQATSRNTSGFTLVYVARLVAGKGHEMLIRAVPQVLDEFPSTRVILVGAGPLERDLRQLVIRLGLQDNVVMPGETPNPTPYFRSADLFVIPSESEGMPRSTLEAALFGLPVVAQPLPCFDSFLRAGENCLYCGPDEGGLAATIITALSSIDTLRISAGKAAQGLRGRLERDFRESLKAVSSW